MNLSVCLITKNEEKNLQRVLGSFESVAGEIILTDTGSTDGTVKLAKNLGAEVNHFKWCDDLYLITENKLINVDNRFKLEDMGGFSTNNKLYFTEKDFWEDDEDEYLIKSLCCHKSCYNLL